MDDKRILPPNTIINGYGIKRLLLSRFERRYKRALYLCWNCATGEQVVIKHYLNNNAQAIEEWHILKTIRHPNVVKMLDYFEYKNGCFIVLEYIEGQQLKTYIRDNRPLSEDSIKTLLSKLLGTLRDLEKRYRFDIESYYDFSIHNTMCQKNGEICLLDFENTRIKPRFWKDKLLLVRIIDDLSKKRFLNSLKRILFMPVPIPPANRLGMYGLRSALDFSLWKEINKTPSEYEPSHKEKVQFIREQGKFSDTFIDIMEKAAVHKKASFKDWGRYLSG